MDNKLLRFIAKQITEEADELDLEEYTGTHVRLMFLADIILEMTEEEKTCGT